MEQPPDSDASSNLDFRCNVCGADNACPRAQLQRETPTCDGCGSTVRMRGFVHALSLGVFGRSLALTEMHADASLRGLGLSDWDGYAVQLARLFDYRNTYYDREPRLDITAIPKDLAGSCDFVTSNDVFEHVLPPVEAAFDGVMRLLKPGGVLVVCVPFAVHREELIEHFPELHDWRIEQAPSGPLLVNRTASGREQVFDGLKFHGGEGATLEMRIFSRSTLLRHLRDASFVDIQPVEEDALQWGIHWPIRKSLPVLARKPH